MIKIFLKKFTVRIGQFFQRGVRRFLTCRGFVKESFDCEGKCDQ